MLTRLTRDELPLYAPWAYSLAMSAAHASYPTWQDGIKTRTDFLDRAQRAFTDEEVLLFRHGGRVCGWIQWYAVPEESYAMTVSFLVEDHAQEAAAELAAHVARTAPGVTLDVGLDGANAQAAAALEGCGFVLLERSVNHTMLFDCYTPTDAPAGVSLLTGADAADFRRLHDRPDMYWNAERILADLSGWKVYIFRRNGRAEGALVCRARDWPEVFSVDFDGGAFRPEIYRSLMTACLNDVHAAGHHHMTYFEEEAQALPILAALGFTRVGDYLAYRKELKED